VLNNARICTSSRGNNPPQQNHSICENRGKCNQTCEPIGRFLLCPVETTYLLRIVFSYHGMKLITTLCPSHLFCYQCLAGREPNGRHLFAETLIKMILLEIVASTLLYAACMQIKFHGFNFQLPVDFGFNVCFPHNVSVLNHNSMETS
jgi:hypothetical protein